MNPTVIIKKIASEMGFDQIGITYPEALKEGEHAIRDWIERGEHGSMKYLEDFEARRQRFYSNFPDAKSVVVLGVNYYSQMSSLRKQGSMDPPVKPEDDTPFLTGRVARYAWGKDYHKVIRQKHESLIAKLKETIGNDFRAVSCIDTQPIPERFAATKAGLGFVGKHTGILSQTFGPWLFLSEIVTNLELAEDLPAEGDCGTCEHCKTACPTGALKEDYSLDARLCIAYLTIEHKGIIPRELRPQIKNWIFGCDECLNVCPFGSKSKNTSWSEFLPGEGVGPSLSLDELFEMRSNAEYERRFRGSAISRASRKQMLRNACIVLGNSGKKEALPYLSKALEHDSSLVRLHAAWAIGQINEENSRVTSLLKACLEVEADPAVREEIEIAYARQTQTAIVY